MLCSNYYDECEKDTADDDSWFDGYRGNRKFWCWSWSSAARNFNLFFAARAIHAHSRSSFLNGKMLTTSRAVETNVHKTCAGIVDDMLTDHLSPGNQKRDAEKRAGIITTSANNIRRVVGAVVSWRFPRVVLPVKLEARGVEPLSSSISAQTSTRLSGETF